MTDWYSYHRILQLTAAPPGWRVVETVGPQARYAEAPLDEMFWSQPVVCFALVERWESPVYRLEGEAEPDLELSRRIEQNVEPIVREENYLIAADRPFALLAPGEEIDESFRYEAIHQADVARRARERRKETQTAP